MEFLNSIRQVSPYEGRTITVISINLGQLPYPLGISGFDYNNGKKRIDKFVQRLGTYVPQPDIIMFQELFSGQIRDYLKKQLANKYAIQVTDESCGAMGGVGVNSGLAIFAKNTFEYVGMSMHYYNLSRNVDNFAKKGILLCTLRSGVRTIYLYTTHMQSGGNNWFFNMFNKTVLTPTQIKESQITIASDFISRTATAPHSLIVYGGDFNLEFNRTQYHPLTNIGLRDTFDPHRSLFVTTIWDAIRRIDLFLSNDTFGSSISTDHFGRDVTDHFAIVGTFTIK
jgi:hypothetical protein